MAAATLLLSGPASADQDAAPDAPAASDAPVVEEAWDLQVVDGLMILSFSKPETDDIAIELTCRLGSGQVSIWAPLGRTEALRLRAGGQGHAYPSIFRMNYETGGERSTETRADDPVLVAFGATGALTVGTRAPYAARTLEEQQAIKGFLEGCARPSR